MGSISFLSKKSTGVIGVLGIALSIAGCSDDFGRAACYEMHGNRKNNCLADAQEKQDGYEHNQSIIKATKYHNADLGGGIYKKPAIYIVDTRQTHDEYMPYTKPSDVGLDKDILKLVTSCHDEIRGSGREKFLYNHYNFVNYRHTDEIILCAHNKSQELINPTP